MTRWEGDDIRIELPRVVEAHIRTVGGEVAITAATGPASIEVQVVAGEAARVDLDGGVLTVVHQPARWIGNLNRRMEAVVTVTVPPETPVAVQTVSADVVLAGLQAGASINTVSGAITVSDLAGGLTARSVSGDIEAKPVDGDVTVNTVSGEVAVTGRVPALTARAVSGDLTFDLDHAPEASLSTVSGEVLVRLPAGANLRLDASTMSGHLDSAFPVAGSNGRRRLSGLIGSDETAPHVDVRTMSGDVALLRKELARAGAGQGEGDT